MRDDVAEIACDESGYEGEKLIRATTDVFAHASVLLDTAIADDCMRELRRLIRSPATEYKANHLLRGKHRDALVWVLGPAAPLLGNSHVYLIDKAYFVVGRLAEVLVGAPAWEAADALFPAARSWEPFLVAANDVLRGRGSAEEFARALDALPSDAGLFQRGDPHAAVARLRADAARLSIVDPLIPSLMRAVEHWSAGGRTVAIVHDRQNTLPDERITQLQALLPALASLTFASSATDSRIQLADILAGVARKIASDALNGRGDGELTELLRPYVDAESIWGDGSSWSALERPPVGS